MSTHNGIKLWSDNYNGMPMTLDAYNEIKLTMSSGDYGTHKTLPCVFPDTHGLLIEDINWIPPVKKPKQKRSKAK